MTQAQLWTWVAAGAGAVALLAGAADWRRSRRRHLDKVGWMPWTLVQVVALVAALGAAAIAVHG